MSRSMETEDLNVVSEFFGDGGETLIDIKCRMPSLPVRPTRTGKREEGSKNGTDGRDFWNIRCINTWPRSPGTGGSCGKHLYKVPTILKKWVKYEGTGGLGSASTGRIDAAKLQSILSPS